MTDKPDRFPSTRQSLLSEAASGQAPQALAAVAELYWKPVYKHLRLKWRLSDEDAADLTQTAFAALLEHEWIARFDASRGSFRTYLRTCVDGLVLDGVESRSRLKRGAGASPLPLDFAAAERELAFADPGPTPDEVFEREWRREVLAKAVDDLRRLCDSTARAERFAIFQAYDLAVAERPSYDELAARHGLPATQVTNHLAWARRELKRLALERINATAGSATEARADARQLFGS
jgi:RNA polymerase sigma factor (sigma-70 family)